MIKFHLIAIFGMCFSTLAAENSFKIFNDANQSFDRGLYDVAIGKYKSLINGGLENGDLHYNLANSYFKSGKLGLSVFHYRKALEFSPRDPDVRFNLNYAREKVLDQVERQEGLWARSLTLLQKLNEKESYIFLAITTSLLGIICLLNLFKSIEWAIWCRNILGLGVLLGVFFLGANSILRDPFGVIIVPEAKVYSGLGKDNVILFALHEGVEFSVAEAQGLEWKRIRLPDGKQGWIRSENIEVD
jgi:tetratricopeptide (TPR) repeat protein